MDKHTIGKITSLVLSLAQLAAGVYFVAQGHGWIGAALLLGGGGTALLPRLREPRQVAESPPDSEPPGPPPWYGIVVFALAVGLSGCASWQATHLTLATALVKVQDESEVVIRDARQRDMHDAGLRARGAGGDDAAVRAAVGAAGETWTCAVEGHRAYSAAVGVYLRELVGALGDDEAPLMARLLGYLAPAVAAYTAIGACVDVDLPALPVLPGGAS